MVLCALASPAPALAASKSASAPASAPSTADAASAPLAKATLATIVEASAEQDAFEEAIRRHLPGASRIDELVAEVRAEAEEFGTLDAPLAESGADLSERLVVFDRAARLHAFEGRIESSARQVAQWADRLDADLDRVARRDRDVAGWLAAAQARHAPDALVERLQSLPARHAALAEQIRDSRDRAVLLLDQIVALRAKAGARLTELEARGAAIDDRLRAAHGAPLWRVGVQDDVRGSGRVMQAQLTEVRAYLRSHADELVVLSLGAMAVTLLAARATRRRLSEETTDATTRRTLALFDRPWTAAVMLALFVTVLFGPRAPLLFYNLFWVVLSIPAAILVRRVLETDATLSLCAIVLAIASVAALDPIVGPLPVAGRWLHIVQYLTVAAALLADLRRGRLLVGRPARPVVATRLTLGLAAILVLAALASVGGSVGTARLLGHGALGAIGFWLVLVVLAHLVYGLCIAVLDATVAQSLRVVSTRGAEVRRALRRLLFGVVVLGWLVGMLTLLGLTADLVAALRSLLDADLVIGEVTLSTANIVAGLTVLAGTLLLVKVIRLLLDVEILPRVIRRRGVAFALSALVRYSLATAGVLLALAAMGVDLTKVTVVAGALGVGIGFGLQAVVNNFLSGLILLVERPVTAGDVVQIGDVQGEILVIGVRATTVRTPQGAEVIVPNADLVTKVVSNWTLSDGRRRLEIEVNAPLEGGPDAVQDLLEAVARDVDGVSPSPGPRAWFAGSRDGHYQFRLHVWIDDQKRAQAVQSALQLLIARRLEAAGIRAV